MMPEPLQSLFSLFFPPRCVVCDARLYNNDEVICDDCRKDIQFIDLPDCPICGAGAGKMPHHKGKPDFKQCPTCPSRKRPVYFDRCYSAVYYNDTAADIVKQLKYNRYFIVATLMARLMYIRMQNDFPSIPLDAIIPVPLHPRRLIRRGYNQAEMIAQELSRIINVAVAPEILMRSKFTRKQTDLSDEDRYFNVRQAFLVREPSLIQTKTFILLDDVYTTGSTLNAAAEPLKRAGAAHVLAFTFAHA